jgi:threonine/homoserine/homoserine lactone efflux protein
MDYELIIAFVLATLAETLTPGPTLALVLEARTKTSTHGTVSTVVGVALANVVWVLIAILAMNTASGLPMTLQSVIKYCGVGVLMAIASRRIISSSVEIIAGDLAKCEGTSHGHFWAGFTAHAFNPLTVGYYVSTFTAAVSGKSVNTVIAIAVIAVLSDLLIYGFIATFRFKALDKLLELSFIKMLAGIFLFYLVAHTLSPAVANEATIALSPTVALTSLLGFLFAAVSEAYYQVKRRKGNNNKVLWRSVAMWGACFSILALVGGVFALIDGIASPRLGLDVTVNHRIRICFVAAAVIAAALAFSKAFGELQDEQSPSSANGDPITIQNWRGSPLAIGGVSVAVLIAIFLLLTLTGFKVK